MGKECFRVPKINRQLADSKKPRTQGKKGGWKWVTICIVGGMDTSIQVEQVGIGIDYDSEVDTGEVLVWDAHPESFGFTEFMSSLPTNVGKRRIVAWMGMNVHNTTRKVFDSQLPNLMPNFVW